MNVLENTITPQQMTDIFALIGKPNRLNILLAIGNDKVCVCQLEAVLGLRQAYISQQLMLLRDSGLVETERSGRHIFYHLSDPRWLEMVKQAASILGVNLPTYNLPKIQDCNLSPVNETTSQ
jgi:ArsR family transcriptional regulator